MMVKMTVRLLLNTVWFEILSFDKYVKLLQYFVHDLRNCSCIEFLINVTNVYVFHSFHRKGFSWLNKIINNVRREFRCDSMLWNIFVSRAQSCIKDCPYSELFWSTFFSHFPALRLNTARYELSLRIQSECGKMQEKCGPE